MTAVAIGANRCLGVSRRDRAPVHALLVGKKGARCQAAAFHDELLAVATAAGRRDVRMTCLRLRIARWEDRMSLAVAIEAASRLGVATLNRLSVETFAVSSVNFGVTFRAVDLNGRRFVRYALDVGVAAQTIE